VKKFFLFVGRVIYWLWKFLTTGFLVFTNLVVLVTFLFVLMVFFRPEVTVPDGSALIIAPVGDIVEKSTAISPISRILNGFVGVSVPSETLLQDILDVIDAASQDNRIKLIVLSLDKMEGSSLNQLDAIGLALDAFKQTGKKVIAVDDQYNQRQYYLASYADEIYLNPMGSIELRGFAVFGLYMKDLIDRMAVNFHIFRVGTFKSATEPFSRNDMSEEAKMANRLWLTNIWNRYCSEIAGRRGLKAEFFNSFINDMPRYLHLSEGSMSRMALAADLVDGVKTRPEIDAYLSTIVGRSEDGKTYKNIGFSDYLETVTPSYTREESGTDQVGLIVARGNIMYGQKIPGQISSEELCALIREARENERIKAVVLRIDSGGGSALASEQIRQELVLLQQKGKPLVVSMGALAASGAYWISASADKIFASPSTLTGSIGIFGVIPTFEESIAKLGIHSDGISTTRMAGAGNLTVPLSEEFAETVQLSVEEGYSRFLTIVSEGRHIPQDQVEKLAEGRVWDGITAMKLGLIDQYGNLDDAVAAAAELAELSDYNPIYVEEKAEPANEILRQFGVETLRLLERSHLLMLPAENLLGTLQRHMDLSLFENDPSGIYAHCMLPYPAIAY